MRKTYSKFGVVRDAFIPLKRSKVTGRNFGFVRYDNEKLAENAVERTNGIWIEDRKLFVKMASFDKWRENTQQNTVNKENFIESGPLMADTTKNGEVGSTVHNVWARTDGKIFAQAVNGQAGRKMKEIILGNGGDKENQCPQENIESIEVHPVGIGWLNRSAIGKMRRSVSPQQLQEEFKKENIKDVEIKAMGGRFLILTFQSNELRDEVIKEKWLMGWFYEIKPWEGDQAKDERFAWIACFGMPLNAWSVSSFKMIGDKWGQFLEVDENTLKEGSYEKGRFLIATEKTRKIEGHIQLQIEGKKFMVRVEEEESFRIIKSSKQLIDSNPIPVKEDDEKDASFARNKDVNHVIEGDLANQVDIGSDMDAKVEHGVSVSESQISDTEAKDSNSINGEHGVSVSESLISDTEAKASNSVANSFDVEDAVLATTNKDKEVVEFDEGFWNLSEVCFFNEKVVEGIQLVVDLNPTDVVEDIGKGKRKQKRIEDKLGFPKPKKGRRKQKKCVVFRSAIAAAALSASSNGINRFRLNAAQASRSLSKILDEDYLGEDDEIISRFSIAS